MPVHIVPDYIIYDELKKQRERRSQEEREQRPQLEMPRYVPYWPEHEDAEHNDEAPRDSDNNAVIIQMI